MKIIRDEASATWTFVPVTPNEEVITGSLLSFLEKGEQLVYGGAFRKEGRKPDDCALHFHARSTRKEKVSKSEHVTLITSVHRGGTKLVLKGTENEDWTEVHRIRMACRYGSGGLNFLQSTVVDGKKALLVTAMCCKHCGTPMIRWGNCEWATCESCRNTCEHEYEEGAVHGPGLDIGVGEFCTKCGQGKPVTEPVREKSMLERHLEVEEKLGIRIIYPNNPVATTPQQLADFNEFVRQRREPHPPATP